MTLLQIPRWVVPGALLMCFVAPAKAQEAETLSARFQQAARAVKPGVVSLEGTVRPARTGIVPPTGIRAPGVTITVPGFGGALTSSTDALHTGSGVVVDADKGRILTADHVVADSPGLTVILPDGQARPVTSVLRDPASDLALLTIQPGGLTPISWGDSDSLSLGDWVLTVGSPYGLTGTVSAGIVSGESRSIRKHRFEDLIQTDASVYPGSSGGPLVNLKGEVVGIVIALQGEDQRGPGFAIPARRARRVAEDLATVGHVRRAILGVRLSEQPNPNQPGVLVTAVETGSPADMAGIRPGDVLLKVGDRPVSTPGEIRSLIEFAEIGKPLSLSVQRGDETLSREFLPAEQGGLAPLAEPDFIRPGEVDLREPRPIEPNR